MIEKQILCWVHRLIGCVSVFNLNMGTLGASALIEVSGMLGLLSEPYHVLWTTCTITSRKTSKPASFSCLHGPATCSSVRLAARTACLIQSPFRGRISTQHPYFTSPAPTPLHNPSTFSTLSGTLTSIQTPFLYPSLHFTTNPVLSMQSNSTSPTSRQLSFNPQWNQASSSPAPRIRLSTNAISTPWKAQSSTPAVRSAYW